MTTATSGSRTLPDGREVIVTELADRPASDPFRYGAVFPGEENVTGTGTDPEDAIVALLGHQKYLDAAYAASEPERRFRAWVDAGRPGLIADPAILCASSAKVGEDDERYEEADENGWAECGKMSRYIVERSDEDASFGELGGGSEVCEEHLGEEVFLMMDGDDAIRAVVTPRWGA